MHRLEITPTKASAGHFGNSDRKHHVQANQLQQELAFYERQLERYYGEGDCAYERALQQAYQTLVEQRQRQLAALRAAGL